MYTLEKSHNSLWLNKDGKAFVYNEPYLMIRHDGFGYSVRGVCGFGGMGYSGPIATRTLVKGLNRLGVNITAKELLKLIREDA